MKYQIWTYYPDGSKHRSNQFTNKKYAINALRNYYSDGLLKLYMVKPGSWELIAHKEGIKFTLDCK